MTEDLLERMHMADQDDDDADLKQLKQLRQVWLSMPDEDPPMKGLDALMAAARTKAEDMQPKPSWWARLAATLVRPQVLALATVIVVAGGAVLINRHHDEIDATKSAVHEERDGADNNAMTEAPAPIATVATGTSAGSAAPPVSPPTLADPTPKFAPPTEVKEKLEVAKPVTPPAHTSPPKKPAGNLREDEPQAGKKGGGGLANGELLDDTVEAPPKQIVLTQKGPPAPMPPAPMPTPDSAPPPSPPPAKSDAKPVAPGSHAQLATDSDVQNQPETVGSMLARAHEAAVRGDCVAAKTIAAKIANQDSSYYRSTVLKDAVLVKCL